MAWLDAVKGAIFNPDPNAPAEQAPTTTVKAGNISPGIPMTMSSPVNPEFVAAIRKAVFGRNTALTQLMAAADKLVSIIPDASTRLKAAYATVADGRTVKQIADAVDVHLSDVDGEEQKFQRAIEGKAQTEVAPLEQRSHLASQAIEAAQQQITQANARIVELTTQIGQQQQEQIQSAQAAQAKKQELELMANNFKLAANAVRSELQSNKTVILTALG